MTKKKLFMLALLAVVAFSVGYGVMAKAWPTPYHRGYFTGNTDDPGEAVLPAWGGDVSNCYANGLALPTWVDSADEFINFIHCKLTMVDDNNRSHVGAAFIISTMSGMQNINPGPTEFNEFAARVRYADSRGWVNWHAPFACIAPNTYSQNNGPRDVATYGSCDTPSEMITFSRDGSAGNRYIIKRICANPLGDMSPIATVWSATGATTVTDGLVDPGDTQTDISTQPGQTLRFNHRITNNGPGIANIWYATYAQPNATPFTGQYYNNATLSGAPVMTRSDPGELKFEWSGSPGGPVVADNFSVRWTKTEYLPAGTYQFNVVMDDGVRVYVDGALIIDRWIDQGPTFYAGSANLADGNHTIVVEYYERAVSAVAFLWYNRSIAGGVNAGSFSPTQFKDFSEDVFVPLSATPGSKICRRILWDWKNSTATGDFAPYGGSWGMAPAACATIAADYNLNPTVTTPVTTFAQEGETIQFNYAVQNVGTASGSSQCYVQNQSGAPVAVPGLTCAASQNFPAGGPAVPVGAEGYIVPAGTAPGTRICRTLFVQPAAPGVANRASPQTCVLIAKGPYVHFMGGDVWAGGGFIQPDGSCVTNTSAQITTLSRALTGGGGTAGSSVEYAGFALGKMTQFGSASKALLGSDGIGAVSRSLSFANSKVTEPGEYAAASHCINDYAAAYESAPALAPGALNLNRASDTRHVAGNLTISGTLPAGSQQLYLVDGDVTVSGDILYQGASPSYGSLNDIPSLVIIAKGNIFVDSNVGRMDGIFVARTTFYTCYPKPATLAVTGACSGQLTVNGAVKAGTIDLYRTFGAAGASAADRKRPAEQFNYSTELLLRNVLNNTSSSTLRTTDVRELPPRF